MRKYAVLEKEVGQTPLQCLEAFRASTPELAGVPMAYAGRLDPLASGKLLILIGDECKNQKQYHALDKEYEFELLFGIASDTGDVMGLIEQCAVPPLTHTQITNVSKRMVGSIELSYPHYSSKTVHGTPLHTWTLQGKLDEIEIPRAATTIYDLSLCDLRTETLTDIYTHAQEKIESIPPVTDERKALGNDFRRPEIRARWKELVQKNDPDALYTIARFRCACSSGTYIRSLAPHMAHTLGTCGLAFSIHRTKIGVIHRFPFGLHYFKQL